MNPIDQIAGGVPTAPDVRRLLDRYPDLNPGDVVPYDDVAETIRAEHGSCRWRSVTTAWRSHLWHQHHYKLQCQPLDKRFLVLDDNGKVRHVVSELKKTVRIGKRAGQVAATVDATKLDDEQRRIHDHNVKMSAMMRGIKWLR